MPPPMMMDNGTKKDRMNKKQACTMSYYRDRKRDRESKGVQEPMIPGLVGCIAIAKSYPS
jgi:hypothetical protein